VLAGFWMRAGALFMDNLLVTVISAVLTVLIGLSPAQSVVDYLLSLALQLGYFWIWNSLGWSPGKRAVGIRIVDAEGLPPGAERGFRRTVGSLVSVFGLFIGYLWALWDPRKQTWHDKMAGTFVVVAPVEEEERLGSGPQRPTG